MNYDAEDTVNESAEDVVNNYKEDVVKRLCPLPNAVSPVHPELVKGTFDCLDCQVIINNYYQINLCELIMFRQLNLE